jgi:hypothetical protein
MPVYEFECSRGHRTEDLVSTGTKQWTCNACHAEATARGEQFKGLSLATRVMSATPTTFHFADRRK